MRRGDGIVGFFGFFWGVLSGVGGVGEYLDCEERGEGRIVFLRERGGGLDMVGNFSIYVVHNR